MWLEQLSKGLKNKIVKEDSFMNIKAYLPPVESSGSISILLLPLPYYHCVTAGWQPNLFVSHCLMGNNNVKQLLQWYKLKEYHEVPFCIALLLCIGLTSWVDYMHSRLIYLLKQLSLITDIQNFFRKRLQWALHICAILCPSTIKYYDIWRPTYDHVQVT